MLSMHELSLPEPMLSLSMLILATYPVADIRPRSKPKSELTSPNFNMLAFGDLNDFGCFGYFFWMICAQSWASSLDAVRGTQVIAFDAVHGGPRPTRYAVRGVPRSTRYPAYRLSLIHI